MDKNKLKEQNVKSIEINKKQYYDLEQVLEVFSEIKIDLENVVQIEDAYYIQAKDIHPTTDFDNTINQALNFNPKKK